jgi:hypothetical protein
MRVRTEAFRFFAVMGRFLKVETQGGVGSPGGLAEVAGRFGRLPGGPGQMLPGVPGRPTGKRRARGRTRRRERIKRDRGSSGTFLFLDEV